MGCRGIVWAREMGVGTLRAGEGRGGGKGWVGGGQVNSGLLSRRGKVDIPGHFKRQLVQDKARV